MFAKNLYFSNKYECTKISKDEVTVVTNLTSDHEEADTKFVALAHAVNVPPSDIIMIRSPSGSIDILTLFVANDFGGVKVLIDNGTGKHSKIIYVASLWMLKRRKLSLVCIFWQ